MWLYGVQAIDYVPNQHDLAWTENTFNMLRIGGVQGFPRSGLMYKKVSNKKMQLIAVMPLENVEEENRGLFKQQQIFDHNAFKASCKALSIELDESYIVQHAKECNYNPG